MSNILFIFVAHKTKNIMEKKRKLIDSMVSDIYIFIGIDKPSTHDDIVDFIFEDVNETADSKKWHSGDVAIAFRRFLEKDSNI